MKIPSYVLIVTSDEGTGKSQLVKFLVGLCGAHGKIITDREMESDFDDWKAAGILMAGAEEVSFSTSTAMGRTAMSVTPRKCRIVIIIKAMPNPSRKLSACRDPKR
jgi:hypothetical protein